MLPWRLSASSGQAGATDLTQGSGLAHNTETALPKNTGQSQEPMPAVTVLSPASAKALGFLVLLCQSLFPNHTARERGKRGPTGLAGQVPRALHLGPPCPRHSGPGPRDLPSSCPTAPTLGPQGRPSHPQVFRMESRYSRLQPGQATELAKPTLRELTNTFFQPEPRFLWRTYNHI